MEVSTLTDMIDRDTERPFTDDQWEHWFYSLNPHPHRQAINQYADKRKTDLVTIMQNIPKDVLAEAQKLPDATDYVALTDESTDGIRDGVVTWAKYVTSEDGTSYHEVWLDACCTPHFTGKIIPFNKYHPVPAVVWRAPPPDDDSTVDADAASPHGLSSDSRTDAVKIAGTVSGTFPLNDGWILEGSTKTRLSDIFSIHEMTAYLTKRQIGDARPNCEAAWNRHISYSIDWKKVWKSLGTPLSDATEEKTWRKLLHRAIFVRNRNPEAPSKLCRLDHCSCIESMHHLAQCHVTAPLWLKIIAFLNSLPNY